MGGARVGLWTYFLKVLMTKCIYWMSCEYRHPRYLLLTLYRPGGLLSSYPVPLLFGVTWGFVVCCMLRVFVVATVVTLYTEDGYSSISFNPSGLILSLRCPLGLVGGDTNAWCRDKDWTVTYSLYWLCYRLWILTAILVGCLAVPEGLGVNCIDLFY